MPRKPEPTPSVIDLGALAGKKKFDTFGPHPYTDETDVPFFDFRSSKGKSTDIVVEGSDSSEVAVLSWYNDLAHMNGGDDVAVGALGDDTIFGGAGDDHLFGDTDLGLTNGGTGDNDVLYGDAGEDVLVGDAPYLIKGATGGEDTLNGGADDDILWGDGNLQSNASGGADVFEFDLGSGQDVIMDFRQEDGDLIDLSDYGFVALGDVGVSDDGVDTTLDLGGGNTVLLVGFAESTDLSDADFIFI